MNQNFEKTNSFDVQSGTGKKIVHSTGVKKVATAAEGDERWHETAQCMGNRLNIGQVSEHDA